MGLGYYEAARSREGKRGTIEHNRTACSMNGCRVFLAYYTINRQTHRQTGQTDRGFTV